MKHALISEEQIKQVQETINKSIEMSDGWTTVGQQNVLAVMRSLKPSEPFGYVNEQATSDLTVWIDSDNKHAYTKPLFALEQSK
jgi:hypothetical protein